MGRLVVGLGNPGPDHAATRHNVGFRVLDELARRSRLLFRSSRTLDGYAGPANAEVLALLGGPAPAQAVLVKPSTFMNRSGEAVLALVRHFGLAPEQVLVVLDDLDLPVGALRLRPHGGTGGHNGLRSIHDALASDRCPRLRVGIGPARGDPAEFVLATFAEREAVEIAISVAEAADAALEFAGGAELEPLMTKYNTRWVSR
jgi:PTH1 family peptidyl-tRNA hydrolase